MENKSLKQLSIDYGIYPNYDSNKSLSDICDATPIQTVKFTEADVKLEIDWYEKMKKGELNKNE